MLTITRLTNCVSISKVTMPLLTNISLTATFFLTITLTKYIFFLTLITSLTSECLFAAGTEKIIFIVEILITNALKIIDLPKTAIVKHNQVRRRVALRACQSLIQLNTTINTGRIL